MSSDQSARPGSVPSAASGVLYAPALLRLDLPAECEAGVAANFALLAEHGATVRAALDALGGPAE